MTHFSDLMASFWNTLSNATSVVLKDLQELKETVATDVTNLYVSQTGGEFECEKTELKPSVSYATEALALRHEIATFVEQPKTESFTEWIIRYQQMGDIQEHRTLMDELLGDELAFDHYTTLVPSSCSANEFWSRYIYKINQLQERWEQQQAGEVVVVEGGGEKEREDVVEEEAADVVVEEAENIPGSAAVKVVEPMEPVDPEQPQQQAPRDKEIQVEPEVKDEPREPHESKQTKEVAMEDAVIVTKMDLPEERKSHVDVGEEDWEMWE